MGNPPTPPTDPAIDVRELSHTYPALKRRGRVIASGDRPALDHVTFNVRQGEIFGILGPNGGGKTTLFRIVASMLRPTSGQVTVFGHDAIREPTLVRQQLGVVFQMPSLDVKLTARENLLHHGHLYGISGTSLDAGINDSLKRVGLHDHADDRVETFSGGMRRRVEIAKAVLHRPRLLLLDEPATGLDPAARREVWKHLRTLRDEFRVTIAMTTHLMDEADRCDRLAIISRGSLVAVDSPTSLKGRIGGDVLIIKPKADQPDAVESLRREIADRFSPWPDATAPVVIDGAIHLEKPDGPSFVAELAPHLGDRVRSITVGQPTLEDVFVHLTGAALGED
jgi:ABC-2 type transport system ATP-binding protein